MAKFNDLTGQKFGKLTVISRAEDHINKSGYRSTVWLCECECGNTAEVLAKSLMVGRTKSCGCLLIEKHPEKVVDIKGKRFGRLEIVSFVDSISKVGAVWEAKCNCGNKITIPYRLLRTGKVQSCGCLHKEIIESGDNYRSHGHSDSRLYTVWAGMRQRCTNPSHKSYKDYGGRGITYCAEWDDFATFEQWAVANGYDADAPFGKCTLDRIDVNGNYEPGNCRWVDLATQANNKRTR